MTAPYLQAEARVEYRLTSGFCTVICFGRVLKVSDTETLVAFDNGDEGWVENFYLIPVKESK